MASRRVRPRRKQPSEKQKPFFDKQRSEQPAFFNGPNSIQRKLSIGKANDPKEQEADTAARKVTSEQVQKAEKKEEEPVQKAEKKEEEQPVQKQEKKEEEAPVQREAQKEEEKPVQAKADPRIRRAVAPHTNDAMDASQPSFEKRLFRRKGGGFSLPDDIREEMERKFGTSFRNVRIHTDVEAAAMCEDIHALAFTHGYDIYFNEGMYSPHAPAGKELLAHELAHVVQQNG